jgi:ABC-type multidrug transport system fused ATPase/permease subunit
LTGSQVSVLQQYQHHNIALSNSAMHQEFLKQVPRLALEWLSIFGVAVLLISMVLQSRSLVDVLPVVSAFAVASFRLMPSINRILGSVQSLRFMKPVIDTLHSEVRLPITALNNDGQPLKLEHEIKVENLIFMYGLESSPALHNISLTIKKGESVGFVGASGAGKSTLIDLLLGLLRPTQGRILVDGQNIENNVNAWQRNIGYVPQSIFLTDDSLMRNVAFGVPDDQIDESALLRALKAAQLWDFVLGLPEGLSTFVGERGVRLSGGQRQRIGIARALYHDPDILVLDEATSALDIETERGFMDAVDALHGQKTILIVAHRLTTVEKCDHLFRLSKGLLVNADA